MKVVSLLIDGLLLPIKRWQIEEILDKRLQPQYNSKVENFFITTHAEREHRGLVQTKYGPIPVYFTPSCPATSVYILNNKKFNPPALRFFSLTPSLTKELN